MRSYLWVEKAIACGVDAWSGAHGAVLLLLATVALCMAPAGARSSTPVLEADASGSPPQVHAPSIVLYEQFDAASGNGTPDQDFEVGLDLFDAAAADDFEVPGDAAWLIHEVHTIGTSGLAGAATVSVAVLGNLVGGGNPDLPGAPVTGCSHTRLVPKSDVGGSFVVALPTLCLLTAGRYWLQLQTHQNAATHGQHFWSNRSIRTRSEAVWRNPGNGFGTGCTGFRPQTQCGVGGGASPDLLFRIVGEPAGADLAVSISDAPDPAVAGEAVEYIVEVSNLGPAPASGVSVQIAFPADATPLSTQASDNGSCESLQTAVRCAWPGLVMVSDQRRAAVRVRLPPDVAPGAFVEAAATVSSASNDPETGNDVAVAQTTVVTRADLRLEAALTAPAIAGATLQFSASARNDGPSDARDLGISLTPPAQLQVLALEAPGAICAVGPSVGCRWVGATPPAGTRQMHVHARVLPSVVGTLELPLSAESSTVDPDPADNALVLSVPVRALADLSIDVQSEPDPVAAGEAWTLAATVLNRGPSDAQAQRTSLEIPAGTNVESLSPDAGGSCSIGDRIECTWAGALPVDGARRLVVQLRVAPSTPAPTLLEARFVTDSTTEDLNLGNNVSTVRVSVITQADLRLALQAQPTAVTVGGTSEVQLSVSNHGPSDAQTLEVRLTLGADLRFSRIGSTSADCDLPPVGATGVVLCRWNEAMPPNASRTLQVHVSGGSAGLAELRGSALSTTPDVSLENNQAIASIAVGDAVREIPSLDRWSAGLLVLLLGWACMNRLRQREAG